MHGRRLALAFAGIAVMMVVLGVAVWQGAQEAGRDAGRRVAEAESRQHARDRRQEARQRERDRVQQQHFYTSVCERNNIVKAEGRVTVSEAHTPRSVIDRRDRLFVILDCAGTFSRGGRGVPLTHHQEKKYLDVVRRAKIPVMRNGEVVGEREPEQGDLADF